MLALIKARGYSNTRDLIVRGILEQHKSSVETQCLRKFSFGELHWRRWSSV